MQRAGVLTAYTGPGSSGFQPRTKNEMTYNVQRNADKKWMQLWMNNNKTANGMKHYKNQSLTF